MGTVLVPNDEEERTQLQTRLIHAGLYGRQAMAVFLGVKLLLMVAPALVGLVVGDRRAGSAHGTAVLGRRLAWGSSG